MPLPTNWLVVGLGLGYLVHSGTVSWRSIAGAVALGAAGLCYALYRWQEHLLFQPRIFPQHITPSQNPPGMRHPGEVGLEWEDVRLTASDGTRLHAWLIRPDDEEERRARPTMLYFHENAGNMGMRMDNLKLYYEELGVNILILSYRGYGESEGVPSEEGLFLDAEAAYQFIRQREDLDTSRLVLFGRSLGGAVAIDLASKHEADSEGAGAHGLACVVLENTFSSISGMVDVIFPYLSFAKAFLLRMKWESIIKVASITRPILFLSGARDEIVPAIHMKDLYAAAVKSEHKEFELFENGMHNDTWRSGGEEYLRVFRQFLAKHAGVSRATSSASSSTRSAL